MVKYVLTLLGTKSKEDYGIEQPYIGMGRGIETGGGGHTIHFLWKQYAQEGDWENLLITV